MSELPNGWEFLRELPKGWTPPPGLRRESKSTTLSLLLEIISSDLAGNDILEMAGRMLTAYAALNSWLPISGNRQLGFEGVARLEVELSFIARDVYSAWARFCEISTRDRRVGADREERRALIAVMSGAARRLEELRQPGE